MFTIAPFRLGSAESFFLRGWRRKNAGALLLAGLGLLGGCASGPFPKDVTEKAKLQPAFSSLRANPEAFKGATVIIGGTIIHTANLKDHTEIEVLQKPLDSDYEPKDVDTADGRFLARCKGFFDPEIFEAGRDISVAGEVEGKEERPVGEVSYTYPVIACRKAKIWYRQRRDYYSDPYWYGPYGWYGWPYWSSGVVVRPRHMR